MDLGLLIQGLNQGVLHMQETHTSKKRNWAAKFLAIAVVASMVASTLVLFAPEASARTGTGSFGYIKFNKVKQG